MSRQSLLFILILLGAFALGYAAYDSLRTTSSEAGDEIREAADSSADLIKDTAKEIKQEAHEI